MALPKLLQKLFQNGGSGSKLNESIMPHAYARSVNGKQPDSVGNIEIPARNVGDEWHSFTGQIPVGGVPYCGQEVTRATYADLWAWVQAQGLVKTESEWQALNTSQNGNVPFYSSGNGSTTFRMPKVVGYIKGAASLTEAGGYTAEGLPNITGSFAGEAYLDHRPDGAFYASGESSGATGGGTDHVIYFDASRSSTIYGNSDHVTPETSIVLFGVYAFGEITNVGALDADTLATGLAAVETGLAAVETGLATKLETSTPHLVETWSIGAGWYRKWSDGWIEQGGSDSRSGTATVTLPVAMKSSGYTIVFGNRSGQYEQAMQHGQTTTGFKISNANGGGDASVYWYVAGWSA